MGLARRALDEALNRVSERILFGAPMAVMPTVQASLAEMALDVDAAALLIYRAAWTKDKGAARISREASMAKLHATEIAQTVIDKAVQLHGGDGVRSGQTVEALYREIRALRIYEGASEVQKLIIARQVLDAATGAIRTPVPADARHIHNCPRLRSSVRGTFSRKARWRIVISPCQKQIERCWHPGQHDHNRSQLADSGAGLSRSALLAVEGFQ